MDSEMSKSILGNANVKIIGKAGYESRQTIMKQMGFDERFMKRKRMSKRSFAKLRKGRFIVQMDVYDPFKIKNRKWTLGNRHSMKDKKRRAILEEQKQKYYTKPIPYQVPSTQSINSAHQPTNPFENKTPTRKMKGSESLINNKLVGVAKRKFRQ